MKKTTLLIIDDLPEIREGLRTLLALQDDMEVIGEASNGSEGVQLATALKPDVVITDLQMPDQDGIITTYQIKEHGYAEAVIILTIHSNDMLRQRATQAGADAYVEKSAGIDTLIEKIRAVSR